MVTAVITAFMVLCALFAPDEIVRFRVFPDRKDDDFKGAKLECKLSDFEEKMEPVLKKHNLMNRAISFIVNFGGQLDREITRINAQFVEMDFGTFEEQRAKILAFPIRPSMVIKTRKSYHVYWFLIGPAAVELFRVIQQRLAQWFNGDPNCVNESRAMRLPGFNHCKQEPLEVRVVDWHPENRYTQEELMAVLPELDTTPVVRRDGTDKGIEQVMSGCDFIKYCILNAAALPEPLWYAMITNLALFRGGTDKIHEISAPYPGYNVNATQAKINHYLSSGTGPMTCKAICERGFACPKFAAGGCGVKSPAALSTKPMSVDGLREVLSAIALTGDIIKDSQLAKNYVEDFLLNQDPVTAEGIIRQDILRHFRLTTASASSLVRIYKDAHRDWKNRQSARRADTGESLPPWYVVTDKGIKFLPGVLAKYLEKTCHIIYVGEQYYIYRGGVYRPMSDAQAQAMVQDKMLATETRMRQILDAENQWRLLVLKDANDMNADHDVINLQNGLYSVSQNQLDPHTPDYLSTIQLNLRYDPDADCPRFKAFLLEAMCGDMEQVRLIQEMLGYCLVPGNRAQKAFLIVGEAAAGKSVLLRVIGEILLGRDNVSHVSWQDLNDKFKIAELVGKLANIFADLPSKNIDDNGIFKTLTGQDELTVERKFKHPFSFHNIAKLIFSCNSIPNNYGDRSDGFYRKLIIIRFNKAVPEERRDPNLLDKLREEADGIVLFALEGLHRLMANQYRFSVTQTNQDELQRYRENNDSVLSFVRDRCVLDEDKAVGSNEIYSAYKGYCEEEGMRPCGHNNFTQRVKLACSGVTSGHDSTGNRRVLKGICLNDSTR